MLFRILVIVGILLFLDLYAFQAVRTITKGRFWLWGYWVITFGILAWLAFTVANFDRSAGPQNRIFTWLFGIMVLFYVPKMVIAFPLRLEDLFRVIRAWWKVILSVLPSSEANVEATSYRPERRKIIYSFNYLGRFLFLVKFDGCAKIRYRRKHSWLSGSDGDQVTIR